MKLYAVYGVEWHRCRELLGVYDSEDKAVKRANAKKKIDKQIGLPYDEYTVTKIELNKDIEE